MYKWVAGARPKTLPAAIAPVAVATALAGENFDPFLALLALLVSLSLQIGVNYANDYSDGVKGTDDNRIGPMRLVASGINNLRDRAADELVGKRTLAVRLGDSSARAAFIALLLIAHISVLLSLQPWTLITLVLLPMTFSLIKAIRAGAQGAQLIPLLGKTGQLQLRFAILLSLGLLLS
ncbi:MAG: hypothetical protein EBY78_04895 [Actinobacteria bacterium]|nr:hypothetical protein [Actinomycetota bacterium]